MTFNAPKESCDYENEYILQGKIVVDLILQIHANIPFFFMGSKHTFACYDVMKNGDIENDFARFEAHINSWADWTL